MPDQISMSDIFDDTVFNIPFSANEADNEAEEDISDSGLISISDMTVTGTDWTTETIVRQMEKGNIMLDPDFQRRDAWTPTKKSRFIESLLMGFPIPQIILAEQKGKKGKFIVIDGKQRLLSLQQFMREDDKQPSTLKLCGLEVKKELNGKTYRKMLDENLDNELDALSNQPIRTVVVRNWPSVEILYLIFLRLNTGSVKLSPQELRQALYPGKFISFANKTASSSEAIKRILKLKGNKLDFRMRDVEILIRYMAFKFFAEDYSGSMQSFLDNTCNRLNKEWSTKEAEVIQAEKDLTEAEKCVRSIFGDDSFSKYKEQDYEGKTNRAVMDVMLYYFSIEEIRSLALLHSAAIKAAYEKMCSTDQRFMDAIEQTTKSMNSVCYRFNKWAEVLSACISIHVSSPYKDRQ